MAQFTKTSLKLLAILNEFYRTEPGQILLDPKAIEPTEVPEPYQSLLVHERDMTSTLEDYHREEIVLRVLERKLTADALVRHVVLEGARSSRIVEYGAIRIELNVCSEQVRSEVLADHIPLGGILNAHGVQFESCPGAFFEVRPNDAMNRVLRSQDLERLYGRCNRLSDRKGRTIAEVVEILPLEKDQPTGSK